MDEEQNRVLLAHFLCGRGVDSSFEANIACEHAELIIYNQKLCDQFTSKCLGLSIQCGNAGSGDKMTAWFPSGSLMVGLLLISLHY